jgi:hypothetical protein
MFNGTKANGELLENIINSTQKPLKSFNIANKSDRLNTKTFLEDSKTVEYIFNKGDNVLKNISNYLLKSNVDLLFVNRGNNNSIKPNIKDIINKLNCSLILTT